ncbi:F-box protein with a domain protein [Perilla frutescens var. hirtella]|uniref:F-box protein with a domain protein n=1 Tax=Perilla frutescens var. hirtella TaxID=608512 RepID=A0AAD4PAD9_PERFH|nr:F-box protein with a domain protein [Perilla frutescens var. hirtella]
MAALKASSSLILHSPMTSSSSHQRGITKATINLPTRLTNISLPKLRTTTTFDELQKQLSPNILDDAVIKTNQINGCDDPLIVAKLYAILEAVADRVEMHTNIGDQRNNWNSLLLSSINSLTLAAATMAGIASISGGGDPAVAMKISSTIMYVAATGMLSIVNKIQPSQLAEEQRNATRLFKQLQNQIQTMLSIGNPTAFDVKETMEKVLALDKAYPLPLLGAMLDKFPATVEPAVWWPENRRKQPKANEGHNGWNGKLEEEMREIVNVVKRKDKEDYLRLGGKFLKLNKFLAMTAPVLTGLAAVASAFVGSHSGGEWAAVMAVGGGALASVASALEHGGQVGMVFEMYRSNAGFFKLMEESIESNLKEDDLERRENGEMLEMKVALQLGRSLSELRNLAEDSSVKREAIDEFASKLF